MPSALPRAIAARSALFGAGAAACRAIAPFQRETAYPVPPITVEGSLTLDVAHEAIPPHGPDDQILDAIVDDAVGKLRPGWVIARDCALPHGDPRRPPAQFRYALLHPDVGIALLDVEPDNAADAVANLRRNLAASGFVATFPGHLPVVYRSLP